MAQPKSSRPSANFLPPIWGHVYFASLPSNDAEFESYTKQIEGFKIQVKEMLTVSTSNPMEIVRLIDLLCRLGLSYHFKSEIEDRLQQYFDHYTMAKLVENNYDLDTVALVFRVFRQYGYKVSCDVFNIFMENNGEFKESLANDVKGILSLYEAAHLRMHGEAILDEALAYTTTCLLKFVANQCDDRLAEHVQYTLVNPFHKSIERLQARQYIPYYEEDEESCNEMLLKFAKLDFNRLQLLYRKELSHISRWYKEIDFASNFPYARERIAEIHLWLVGNHFEPQYTKSRIFANKVLTLVSVLDDIYDVHGSLEEVTLLTDAIQRWDIGAIEQLPDYMKVIYSILLDIYRGFENELKNEGRSHLVSCAKDVMKEMVRGCQLEAEWFHKRYVPPFEEYLKIGSMTSGHHISVACSFLGIDGAGADAFEWLKNSKTLRASEAIFRLLNDVTQASKEKQETGHSATSIQCYMNEYGVSDEEAIKYIREEMIESAWKDINEQQMRPNGVQRELLMLVGNLARADHSFYSVDDKYTNTTYSKEYVKKTFIEPFPT